MREKSLSHCGCHYRRKFSLLFTWYFQTLFQVLLLLLLLLLLLFCFSRRVRKKMTKESFFALLLLLFDRFDVRCRMRKKNRKLIELCQREENA